MSSHHGFEEKPNSRAKIAFIVWTPFDYFVLKNIIQYLPEAEFVIVLSQYRANSPDPLKEVRESVALLRAAQASWRVFLDQDTWKLTHDFFSRYEAIVTLHLWKPLAYGYFYEWVVKKKSIMVSYGVGKDAITAAPYTARFDIALVEGSHTRDVVKPLTTPFVVGVPKYDDWFSKKIDERSVAAIREKLLPNRKTLLYLPTHGKESSLHEYLDAVLRLTSIYNIIIKLHYLNSLTELDMVKRMEGERGILLYDSKDDVLPLLQVANIVISDSSSASLEMLVPDKPLVTLHVEQKNIKGSRSYWDKANEIFPRSIDQQVKAADKRIGEVVLEPAGLLEGVGRAEETWHALKTNRENLRAHLFDLCDGKSGQRAARIIDDYVKDIIIPEQPLWGAAIRAFFSEQQANFRKRQIAAMSGGAAWRHRSLSARIEEFRAKFLARMPRF